MPLRAPAKKDKPRAVPKRARATPAPLAIPATASIELTDATEKPSVELEARAKSSRFAVPATVGDLLDKLRGYLPEQEVAVVHDAYQFAVVAHDGQVRRTGHQYITHPLAVASTLADMRMDHQSIAAAILHDTLEDTSVSKQSLTDAFGPEVTGIVDGVSKLAAMFASHAEAQAENFRKMAMAMARDMRVIMVKLADRLHNMRTIGVMREDVRKRVARETLDFYAPIANRLGMNLVRIEFEDLAFEALHPLRADRLRRAVVAMREKNKKLMEKVGGAIERSLRREGIDARVSQHDAHLYSIYSAMKTEHKRLADLVNVFGFRIVVDQVDACYRTLGVLHNLYKPIAGRFKDYIAIPKANGYQSLHTALMGMQGMPVDVQIRTRQMETVAENGIAGDWLYEGKDTAPGSRVRAQKWLGGLLDLQQRAGDSLEFIESLKVDLFPDEVYVFTPKGDILELPQGASPIDFAYAVHTDVGNHCTACEVDHEPAPLSTRLVSGQTVRIQVDRSALPDPDWLGYAVSGRARAAILHALKSRRGVESVRLGRSLLNRSLQSAGSSVKQLDFRRLRRVFTEFGVRRLNDLLAKIGIGDVMAYVVAQRLLAADDGDYEAVDIDRAGPVAIRGSEGLVVSYAHCCSPVPGDPVVGLVVARQGMVVHLASCNNVRQVERRRPQEIVPARWSARPQGEFSTSLTLSVRSRKGVVAELAAAANAAGAGIDNITVNERSADLASVRIAVSVTNVAHLARIRQRLLVVPSVMEVERTSH